LCCFLVYKRPKMAYFYVGRSLPVEIPQHKPMALVRDAWSHTFACEALVRMLSVLLLPYV
jgi:hypothetical protein